MTVTMINRRRDDLSLYLTGLVHARALFEARGATPEEIDTLDHETKPIRGEHAGLSCKAAAIPAHPGLPEEFRDGTYRKLTTG